MHYKFLIALVISFALFSCNKESQFEGFIDSGKDSTSVDPPDNTVHTTKSGSWYFKNYWTSEYITVSNSNAVLNAGKVTKWDVLKIDNTDNCYLCIAGSQEYLSDNGAGKLVVTTTVTDNIVWKLEPVTGSTNIYIKNTTTGLYINYETGELQDGTILPGWFSAQWLTE